MGHVVRMNEDRLPKRVMKMNVEEINLVGSRGRGWGKGLEYIDCVIQRDNRAIKPENISEI